MFSHWLLPLDPRCPVLQRAGWHEGRRQAVTAEGAATTAGASGHPEQTGSVCRAGSQASLSPCDFPESVHCGLMACWVVSISLFTSMKIASGARVQPGPTVRQVAMNVMEAQTPAGIGAQYPPLCDGNSPTAATNQLLSARTSRARQSVGWQRLTQSGRSWCSKSRTPALF